MAFHRPEVSSVPRTRVPPLDWAVAAALALVVAAIFVNTLGGEWVYDDRRQIVQNRLIQDNSQIVRALTSDVWAFKTGGLTPASNYWRPTFTAWCILQHRLFGVASPVGWHAANILLHAGVAALAFLLLRRFAVAPWLAAAAALLWAVHPTKPESVAWVSGSPDPLLAASLLGSMLLLLSARERPRGGTRLWAASLACYALALGSKEVAILWPIVVAVVCLGTPEAPADSPSHTRWWSGAQWRGAIAAALPFAALAAIFLLVRLSIVGAMLRTSDASGGFAASLASAPMVLSWYLGKALWPPPVSMHYALAPLDAAKGLSAQAFWLPLAGLLFAGALAAALAWPRVGRRAPGARLVLIGGAVFFAVIAPALHSSIFPPDHLVHDRYLYLPLLGLLVAVIGAWAWLLPGGLNDRRSVAPAVALGVLAIPAAAYTVRVNSTYQSAETLWRASAEAQPGVITNYVHWAVALQDQKQYDKALAVIDRALAVNPEHPTSLSIRAELRMLRNDLAAAERDARLALDVMARKGAPPYDRYLVIDRLVNILFRQGRLDDAAAMLRRSREELPFYAATFTDNLAIILVNQGRKTEALAELEGAAKRLDGDLMSASRLVLFRLGMLYAELGRPADARATLQRFLQVSEGLSALRMEESRRAAREMLSRLGSP
ncbi:MAG: tetratricopeptide repeat protein [Phycisphaeraceae bacterium]|nr:tetratricopeptide repeat protein [Phycisphaeraceae bacterium]